MTPERKRIVIAEFRGWKRPDHPDVMALKVGWLMPEKWWMCPKGSLQFAHNIPDYGNDHDAISEVYDTLSDEQKIEYLYHLTNIIRTTDPNVTDSTLMLAAIGASREQRMDALVKTIGKWEDE